MSLSYLTTGESHGQAIITVVSGLPCGLEINANLINAELNRRRLAAGRGPRMKTETDKIEILTGLRKGKTIGTPVTLVIYNNKYKIDTLRPLTKLRPGHIDMAGAMKLLSYDARQAAERASARETAGRVAAGALTKILLNRFNIAVLGYTTEIAGYPAACAAGSYNLIRKQRDSAPFYSTDKTAVAQWIRLITKAREQGDTLGGVVEVAAFGVPVGLGDHTQWDNRLDGRIARALMAIPAVKGVEIGLGFGYSSLNGSRSNDLFRLKGSLSLMEGNWPNYLKGNRPVKNTGYGWLHQTNYAGGIEGGLANGETIVARAVVKAIPTLSKPLNSIDLVTRKSCRAQVESADVCAAPAASVIAENVVAFELARAFTDKFGADTLQEAQYNFANYRRLLRKLY
ncbi:MAG: chorismate synthase [Planctomycetes bacterium]|nr:chorismate synthase [Planctomycetota bacterium]